MGVSGATRLRVCAHVMQGVCIGAVSGILCLSAAEAQTESQALPEMTVYATAQSSGAADAQPVAAASERNFSGEQLNALPFARVGEVLEAVPGLIVTQHSGEGKANQYFLRGFNLDHGTDLAITVDGMPVNMPTHGHGQGYADINF